MRNLFGLAGLKTGEADSGAVTLIQRFGSAANLPPNAFEYQSTMQQLIVVSEKT